MKLCFRVARGIAVRTTIKLAFSRVVLLERGLERQMCDIFVLVSLESL